MKIEVWQGDITTLAWMRSSTRPTKHSRRGGVDGAIHRAAGPALRAECERLPELRPGVRCPTGEVRATGAYACRHGMYCTRRARSGTTASATSRHCSPTATGNRCSWPSRWGAVDRLPAISCGVYGYPLYQAAQIAVTETLAAQPCAADAHRAGGVHHRDGQGVPASVERAGQGADGEPRGSMLSPLGDAGFAAAH